MEKQSIVSEAILYLNGTADSANTHYIQAHMVSEEWYNKAEEKSGKELNWSTQPALGSLLDYTINAGNFNITKAIRKWQSGEAENYGIAITAYDENSNKRDTIRLKNSSSSPYLKITYRTATGLESYWGTHATGAGSAGAGYVNDYTGALTVVNTDVVTAGNRFPLSIGHVYNSNDTEEGNGWRLNYEQTIKVPIDTVDILTYPYVYTDEDGTEHYFKKSDVKYLENGASKTATGSGTIPAAKDEDGLELNIVPVNNADLKAKYPLKLVDRSSSVVKYFDTMGRLAMITDSNQYENEKNSATKEKNAIIINYENCGSEVALTNFDDAIAAAQAFRDICYTSGIKVDSIEYTDARDKAQSGINVLKKDVYVTADYKTAKQVNTAAKEMSNLTDSTGTISKSTAQTKSDAILSALKKAKTQAEPLVEGSSKRISSVTDAVGNEAVFTYDAAGKLSTISDPTYEGGKVNSYYYDVAGNLTQITFASGKNAYYTYREGHMLTSQRDHDGYKVEYTYRESDNRIIKVSESHKDTPGQTYSIQYNTDNTTTFRFSGVDDVYGTDDDIENIHVFDEQGRAICIYSKAVNEDKVLGATACTYETETSDDVTKRNKIKDTAVVGMHANNLLANHSFEYKDSNWTLYKNVDETPESGALNAYSTTRKYIGKRSAYVNMGKRTDGVAGFKQEAGLTAGTYTFSGYCKAVSVKNTAAYLKVTDEKGNTYYSNKVTEPTNVEFDNGWQRLEVTFTIDTDQKVTVALETDCGTQKGAGNVAFDCIQLEKGNVANDYNILEDGSFELTEETLPYKWTNLDNSTIKVKDEKVSGGIDGDYCYHITGQPGKDKYLKISTNLGTDKNSFVLSGWIKTNSTPIRKGRDFKIVAYHKEETEETITELNVSNNINAYSEGWKYFCMIIPAASWKDTSFTLRFYDNIGDLYIDGLQLTRNDVQTRKYNSEGELTSSYTAQKSTSYGYDSYGRMNKQTSPSGATMSYTYSKTNETTKIAANIGPDVNMTYDKFGNQISSSSYDPAATTKLELYLETTYTEDGNFDKTETDNAGNVTSYEYNTLTGQLTKTTLPQREGEDTVSTDYIYDSEDRISKVTQGDRSIEYVYGEFDDLTGINHNGFSYNYTYDGFGNVITSSIAGTTICTNEYSPYNGSLVRSVFPDGTATGTTYDEYGKVTSNSLDGNITTKYVYDNDGNVAKKTDVVGGVTTKYDYNDSNLLVRSEVYAGESTASKDLESRMQYTYTKSGKVGTLSYQEKDSDVKTYTYTYAKDDKPEKSVHPDTGYTNWYYDSLRRNNKIVYVPKEGISSSKRLNTYLKYQDVQLTTAEGKSKKATTGLVSEYTNKIGSTTVSQFNYTYDEWGNITKIASPTSNSTRTYEYNQYSEVTNAVETYTNGTASTYEYTYDKGGNILTETVNGVKHTYVYDDVWKDKLISYDGKSITYDIFGCPTNYMGKSMTWDIYGNLTSVGSGSNAIRYTYMGDGQRRSKTVNGVTTTYHYNNGMLLSETTGDETIRYYYDSTGKVVSFSYKKGEEKEKGYYYARNAQGDIIAVYRSEDSKLMGTYEYDLWGRLISATEGEEGVDTDNILTKNPFRYRSYYYDNETGFYNLNARYYDPEIRRFISADSMSVLMVATVSLECKNLFAYSENNPITGKDSSGGIIESAFDIVTLAGSIVDVCCHPTDPWAWAGLVGDAVDLIPVVTGVGEGIKGLRVAAKAADAVDNLHDAGNAAETVADVVTVVNKNTDTMPTGLAGGACFVEGTEIKTSNGEKCIEEIKVGDFVYAKNAETGESDWKPVVQLFEKEVSELIHIQAGNESIETTATHPFWVVGYGFKPAEEIVAGDWLENADGEILQVRSAEIEYQDTPVSVYNFEVEDWHTYYVSEEEVLVHNMCAMTKPSGNNVANFVPDPLDNHSSVIGRNGSMKAVGAPYTSVDLYSEEGRLLQRRFYGEDGRATLDVDFSHGNGDGTHTFPHTHIGDWTKPKPRQ